MKKGSPGKEKAKSGKPAEARKGGAPRGASKKDHDRKALNAMDIVIAAMFVGGLIFAIVAFSMARLPLKDSFVLWPLCIGGAVGAVAGLVTWKITHFESMAFMAVVMLLGGASISIGTVLALNRPLDRSQGEVRKLKVAYRHSSGTDEHKKYFADIDPDEKFPVKTIEVEKEVYDSLTPDTPGDDFVRVRIRPGFFGFAYLEEVLQAEAAPKGETPKFQPPAERLPVQ